MNTSFKAWTKRVIPYHSGLFTPPHQFNNIGRISNLLTVLRNQNWLDLIKETMPISWMTYFNGFMTYSKPKISVVRLQWFHSIRKMETTCAHFAVKRIEYHNCQHCNSTCVPDETILAIHLCHCYGQSINVLWHFSLSPNLFNCSL